jgi:hypothetical protein
MVGSSGNRKKASNKLALSYASMRRRYSDPGPAVLFSAGEIIAVL